MEICFCISGQMRNFEEPLRLLREHAANSKLDATYIVSTWRNRGLKVYGSINYQQLTRMFPAEFAISIPANLFYSRLYEVYPQLEELLTEYASSRAQVSADQVNTCLPGAVIDIQDEADVITPEWVARASLSERNQYYMYYKIRRCNELKSRIEAERERSFDVVVRTRPDKFIGEPSFDLASSREVFLDWVDHEGKHAGDILAYSTSQNMDIYSAAGNCLEFPQPNEILNVSGHRFLYNYLASHHLNLSQIPGALPLADDIISADLLVSALEREHPRYKYDANAESTKLCFQGNLSYSAGNLSAAKTAANGALGCWATNPNAFLLLSRVSWAEGKADLAIIQGIRAVVLCDELGNTYNVFNEITYFRDHLWELTTKRPLTSTATDFAEALRCNPLSHSMLYLNAEVLNRLGEPARALACITSSLSLSPNNPSAKTLFKKLCEDA